jgi:type IV secretory pathway VirB9-like protein
MRSAFIGALFALTACSTGDSLPLAHGEWEHNINISDDGTSTTIIFPSGVATPAVTMLGNVEKGCGPNGEERVVDFSIHTDPLAPDGIRKMVIAGTAAGWCLRRDKYKVYEVRNLTYDPAGHSTGTGTISPSVVRNVRGAPS